MKPPTTASDCPLVTAVIPTRERPDLLTAAIRSALRQSWPHLEVLVVVDGPDPETESRLSSFSDPRLRTLILPERCGGSAARNAGVRAARGEWIAFLDDDDEWLPRKIESQMQAVRESKAWFPVISCRVIAQSSSSSRVLPPRIYSPPQPVADYLFCRTGLVDSGGLIQTSTLLASRELLLAVPFRRDLPMHQDWNWILQAASFEGVAVCMLAQPLAIWRVEDARSSISRSTDWRFSLAWIREHRKLVSPRALSSFIAVQCAWRAQQSGAGLPGRLQLLAAYFLEGHPGWISFAHLLFFCFVPVSVRRFLRNVFSTSGGGRNEAPGLRLVSSRPPSAAALRRTSS